MQNSRRSFMKLGILTAAGAALGGYGKVFAAETPKKWDATVDVLVIGSGAAGITAAVAAIDQKVKVLMIEKMAVLGGSSTISQGTLAVVSSPQQKAKGLKDNTDSFTEDMLKEGNYYGHENLIRNLAERSLSTYEFLLSKGAIFEDYLVPFPGMSVDRILQPSVSCAHGILRPLQNYFTSKGGVTKTRCKADSIIFDEKGAVIGAKIRENYRYNFDLQCDDIENKSGDIKYIRVKGGIICGTGGYANDKVFMDQEFPQFKYAFTTQQPGSDASGFRILTNAGARMLHTPFFRPAFPEANNMGLGMMVDVATGKRFTSETAKRPEQFVVACSVMMKNGGKVPISILDSDVMSLLVNKPHFDVATNAGYITRHDNIDSIATMYNIPKTQLKKTIAEYNKMIQGGKDTEFNRNIEFGKRNLVDMPPFYVVPVKPDINFNSGGALPTVKAEVIGLNTNAPIAGLYVAGDATGGVYGTSRLLGCSILDCTAHGLIAGKEASKRV